MAVVIGKGSFKGFGETPINNAISVDKDENPPVAIGSKLQRISYNADQLKKLKEIIGTRMDSADMRNRMSDVINETNRLVKDTHELIKTFSESEPEDQPSKTKWKTQVQRLKELFHDQLTDYNTIQKDIRNAQRTDIRTSLQKSGCFDVEIDESGRFVKDGHQIQAEAIQAEVDLDLIKEREVALKQLEQDILDVKDIFKDLAGMIVEQGEMIDMAEENINTVQEEIEIAVAELHEAEDDMKSVRQKRICVGAIIFTGVAVIVLIIVLTQVA